MNQVLPIVTPRFKDALIYAVDLHGTDFRKGTSVPYIAHLLSVCAMVLVDGGDEDEAIAALLHDALEDHPGETSREEVARRFGDRVLTLIEVCTDTPKEYRGGLKPPWRERKEKYLDHIRQAGPSAYRVALADKLDNARSILRDYRHLGETLWPRFNAGKADQLWFFRSLIGAFRETGAKGHLIDELEKVVEEIERLAGAG
jgi:(p)ppGpp synthase/HD superfamily hydrolase